MFFPGDRAKNGKKWSLLVFTGGLATLFLSGSRQLLHTQRVVLNSAKRRFCSITAEVWEDEVVVKDSSSITQLQAPKNVLVQPPVGAGKSFYEIQPFSSSYQRAFLK